MNTNRESGTEHPTSLFVLMPKNVASSQENTLSNYVKKAKPITSQLPEIIESEHSDEIESPELLEQSESDQRVIQLCEVIDDLRN